MLIINAQIITMEKDKLFSNGFLRIEGGKIADVGPMDQCVQSKNEEVLDLEGKLLLPGFIDCHTHLGMWEDGLGFEGDDGNEDTDPSTPHLRAVDAINVMDRCFEEALQAGITTVVSGPGSSNPICGQLCALKTYGKRIDDMLLPEFSAMKFALGENPKTTYHNKNAAPVTRMATTAIIREQLSKAQRYIQDKEKAEADPELDPPEFDIKCEALIPVLKGQSKAHFHVHRSDDIFTALRISKEFSLRPVLIHATEGYRIAEILAGESVSVVAGPLLCDRSKPELRGLDAKNPAVLIKNGIPTAICTDHPVIPAQYLALCTALAVKSGMDYKGALASITIEAAKIMGLDHRIGSLSKEKDADMLVFSDDPLSLSSPEMVFINGKPVYTK